MGLIILPHAWRVPGHFARQGNLQRLPGFFFGFRVAVEIGNVPSRRRMAIKGNGFPC